MQLQRAEEMYAEAREHKRLQGVHRRLARERMEELRRFCESHHIAFDFNGRRPNGHGHAGSEET